MQILDLLKKRIDPHGSEFGLAVHLYALTISIRAYDVLEIGRFKGFSTTAMAAGLAFNLAGWNEPEHHRQRPDVDYVWHEGEYDRLLTSVDPEPRPEAAALLEETGLRSLVEFVDKRSDDYQPDREFDLVFIDGDHTEAQTIRDFERFAPRVRKNGLIVIHDFFGYYLPDGGEIRPDGKHVNPVKRAIDHLVAHYDVQPLLIDTGYMSHVVIRKESK